MTDSGIYEVSVTLLAASLLGIPLVLCRGELSAKQFRDLSFNGKWLLISPRLPSGALPFTVTHLDTAALPTLIAGELASGNKRLSFSGQGFTLSFAYPHKVCTYTEDAILFSATAFAEMNLLGRTDRTLCDLDPCSPEGAVCSILAALISGGCSLFLKSGDEFEQQVRIARPTRLFCRARTALLALTVLCRDCSEEVSLPVPFSPRAELICRLFGERTSLARRRRLASARLMRLGGELRGVTVLSRRVRGLSKGFAAFGIATSSSLSTLGCPFVALRHGIGKDSFWRLPRGTVADVCMVEKGGRGYISLSGNGLSLPPSTPIGKECIPNEFRIDHWEGMSLTTDLFGYVLPKGRIFVEKIVNNSFFSQIGYCNLKEKGL